MRKARWFWLWPGAVYATGPTNGFYATEREARAAIRRAWDLDRLPMGTQVWRASDF